MPQPPVFREIFPRRGHGPVNLDAGTPVFRLPDRLPTTTSDPVGSLLYLSCPASTCLCLTGSPGLAVAVGTSLESQGTSMWTLAFSFKYRCCTLGHVVKRQTDLPLHSTMTGPRRFTDSHHHKIRPSLPRFPHVGSPVGSPPAESVPNKWFRSRTYCVAQPVDIPSLSLAPPSGLVMK